MWITEVRQLVDQAQSYVRELIHFGFALKPNWPQGLKKGDVVILHNLSSHKHDGVRKAIEELGAWLLVPAAILT